MPDLPFDPGLLRFAAPRQREALEAYLREGSAEKAAQALSIRTSTVRAYLGRVRAAAAARGYSPGHDLTHPVAEGQILRGASTLYDEDGNVRMQWVKSSADLDAIREAMREFTLGLADEVRGLAEPTPPPSAFADGDLATHYKVGDQHLGLYAWGEETGQEDYDLARSTDDVTGGIDYLVESAPPTEVGCLINVGDFLHANDRKGQTPGSGNQLDTDGRHGKVARRAAHILRHAVLRMLTKHRRVEVYNARGNHDPDAAVSMQIALEAYFENEPRVVIHRNDCKILVWQFGEVVSFIYHGEKDRTHQAKFITSRFREQIGKSRKCYVDNGHVHHKLREEFGPLQFEVWNPLVATDLYHADNLYGADRSITSVVYHRRYGEVARTVCDLKMIRDKEAA